MRRICGVLASALLAGAAHAHDSWIVPDGSVLSVATGNRYPRAELTVPPGGIEQAACHSASGGRASFARRAGPQGCWAELREYGIELDAALVPVYLREARPPETVRDRWQALHAEGIGWRERYRKFARIELAGPEVPTAVLRNLRRPAGLDLEIVPAGDSPLRVGQPGRFIVLSQGQPVPGQAVELVSERNPLGAWSKTDERGTVQWTLPFAGHWLVRTIAIGPDAASAWRSRFATLAFEAHGGLGEADRHSMQVHRPAAAD